MSHDRQEQEHPQRQPTPRPRELDQPRAQPWSLRLVGTARNGMENRFFRLSRRQQASATVNPHPVHPRDLPKLLL